METIEIKNSSSVTEIGYDAKKNEMQVSFYRTGVYLYSDVTSEEYQTIMTTYDKGGSIGSVVHQIVEEKAYVNLGKQMRG